MYECPHRTHHQRDIYVARELLQIPPLRWKKQYENANVSVPCLFHIFNSFCYDFFLKQRTDLKKFRYEKKTKLVRRVFKPNAPKGNYSAFQHRYLTLRSISDIDHSAFSDETVMTRIRNQSNRSWILEESPPEMMLIAQR